MMRDRTGARWLALGALLAVVATACDATGDASRDHEQSDESRATEGPGTVKRVPIGLANVDRLELKWTADIGDPPASGSWTTTKEVTRLLVQDGLVLAQDDQGRVLAFDESCGVGGDTCDPLWTASQGHYSFLIESGIFVGGGGLSFGTAFPVHGCRGSGDACPGWSTIPGQVSEVTAADDGVVLVIVDDSGRFAYDLDCEDAAVCGPLWKLPRRWRSLAHVGEGFAYATRPRPHGKRVLGAFPLRCRTDGEVCDPAWVASPPGGPAEVEASLPSGGHLYVLTNRTFEVYEAQCRVDGGECAPIAVVPIGPPAPARGWSETSTITSDGRHVYVFAANREPSTLYAFPVGCGSGETECEPTWTLAPSPYGGPTEVAVVGDAVIARGGDSLFGFSCDESECQHRWEARYHWDWTQSLAAGGTVALDELVFAAGDMGMVMAFRADCVNLGPMGECEPAWIGRFGGGILTTSPVVTDTGVYVLAADGTISAFGLPEGSE